MAYLHGLVAVEQQAVDDTVKSLRENFEQLAATKRKRDAATQELFTLREGVIELERKTGPTQELCRNIQKREGVMKENYAQMLKIEKEGNEKFRTECSTSTGGILDKIKIEEEDLEKKEKENTELRSKLDQFKSHLELRRSKMDNLKRTKDLEKQLDEARGAQRKYVLDQHALKANSLKQQLINSEEATHTYRQQIGLYTKKFEQFEDTLTRTQEVMQTFEERKALLNQMAAKVTAENDELAKRATQERVAVIKGADMGSAVEKAIAAHTGKIAQLQPQCRDLQTRLKELRQRKAAKEGASSGSSGAAAAPTDSSS
jgi:chromosome segregation ATPase